MSENERVKYFSLLFLGNRLIIFFYPFQVPGEQISKPVSIEQNKGCEELFKKHCLM